MREFGRRVRGPGRVYFTGGATAVLHGWRGSTIDLDLKLDPEPPGSFEAIPAIKDDLNVNVELASPEDFIPALPGWRDRSAFIERHGPVDFLHYDYYAQALAKIERGHAQDGEDVRELIGRGLVDRRELLRLFTAIEPALPRYPSLDPSLFRAKVERWTAE